MESTSLENSSESRESSKPVDEAVAQASSKPESTGMNPDSDTVAPARASATGSAHSVEQERSSNGVSPSANAGSAGAGLDHDFNVANDDVGRAVPDGTSLSNGSTAPLSETIVAGLAAMADALMITISGLVVFSLYVGWSGADTSFYLVAIGAYALVTVQSFFVARLYTFQAITLPVESAPRIVTVCTVIFLLVVTLLFALKISASFSRIWAFSWFIIATTSVCISRGLFHALLVHWARKGILARNVVLVGGGEQARRLLTQIEQSKNPWIKIQGIFDDRLGRIGPVVENIPILGNVDDLMGFARKNRVDDIIIALPWSAEQRIHSIIDRLASLPVQVRLASDLAGLKFHKHEFSTFGDVPMLDVVHKPMTGWKWLLKLAEDLILSILILLLVSPFILMIAIAIKIDSRGPIFFRQQRYGLNNQVFNVYKFRTMYHDRPPDADVKQATKDDPRVTRVGKFLRSSSLDELPQLFNVVTGSMSLVGPRPHAVEHNVQYSRIITGYYARHRVKPGMTGLAQIHGFRGETEDSEKMRKRIEYDVQYIENWSLALDLEIILKTPMIVISQENAY